MGFHRRRHHGRTPTADARTHRLAARPEVLEPRLLLSTYYVSTSGSDSSPGSLSQPLRTIQQAASRAQPGDTVLVRGGTYRETVRPARSGTASDRITFKPYGSETVTISGADPIGGSWRNHSGSIYKAGQDWDLGDGNNQVFVDGRMMLEARWPNTPSLDVSRPKRATADAVDAVFAGQASYATLSDGDLSNFPDGAWEGGVLHIASGQSWVTQTADITDSGSGKLSFDYVQRTFNPKSDRFETPEAGDPYYLTGKFIALDSPGEWFRDDSDGTLYLWTPGGDSPANHTIEAKARQYAFDLTGRAYIDIQGFNLFAATIISDASSTAVRVDGIDAEYVGHFSSSDTGWEVPLDSGIYLAGADSVLRNSTIAFSAGHGVNVTGNYSRVENNVIHDVDYSGTNGAAVRIAGTGLIVRSNTIYNAGRNGVLYTRVTGGRIVHNVIHDVMLQTTDGGGVYTFGTDGQGTEVAYNRVYNVNTGGFGGVGVYFDNKSSNYVAHHNLTWNVNHGLKLNPTSQYNLFYNNTLAANSRSVATSGTRDMTGSVFRNNIFTKPADIGSAALQENNVYSTTVPQFVDPSRNDYRLQSTSPAVDKGLKLPPYTDGYAGAAPDAGAMESGRAGWPAGADDALVERDNDPPAAPRGLTATASDAGVILDWFDSLDPDRAAYNVFRAASSAGPYARVNDAPVTESRYLDSGAPQSATSYYRVVVLDTSGNGSAPSGASTFLPVPDAVPGAPADLLPTPSSATAIDLAWTATPDVFGYRVERRGPGESTFREIGRTAIPLFRDTGLTAGATYAYRVRAENLRGTSSPTASVGAAPLPAPGNFTVTVVSSRQADLSWANVAGETRYDVQRSPDGQNGWLTVASTIPDVTTWSDVSVPTAEGYFYRVLAVGAAGFSRASDVVGTEAVTSAYSSADIASTPEGRTTVVAADTAFDVIAGGRNIFGTSDGFRFVYKPVTGDFDISVRVTALAATVSTSKAGLMARETLDSNSRNVFSSAVASGEMRYTRRLTTGGDTTIVSTGLRSTYPNLWVRLARQGDTFSAWGSIDGVKWTPTGTDTLIMPRTIDVGMAVSAQSTTQTTTARFRELTEQQAPPAPLPPAAPKALSATAATPTVVELTWSASAGAGSYLIERQGPGESSFTQIASNVADTTYRDTGRTPQATYAYRVRAQNSAGRSPYSPAASATTPAALPDKPLGLDVNAVSASEVDVDWDPVAGATSYRLERKGPGESSFREVAAALTDSDYADNDVRAASTYAYRVRAESAAGLSPYSDVGSATTPDDVQRQYRGTDVGDPLPAGSTTEITAGRDYDLFGGGSDVIGSADHFHFAWKQVTGDFDVRVRVQSLTRANAWTKAGLMARESLTAGSKNAFVMATPDVNGHRMSARFSDGGSTVTGGSGAVAYPNNWLRLKRVGSTFTGYRGTDGTNWVEVGTRSVVMADAVYFGMALTSHNTAAAATAQFRDLSDVPTDPVPVPTDVLTGADVGSPVPAGATTAINDSGEDYDVVAGGTDVNGATDRFHFAYKRVSGDFDVKVRVQSLGAASDWSKAGIMAREDLTGGGRNVFALATPGPNGYRVSSRADVNGSTFVNGTGAVSYPNTWLRLKRQGDDFTAWRSTDGVSWTQVGGTRTLPLANDLYLGLAATSHNTTATTTVQFREFANT